MKYRYLLVDNDNTLMDFDLAEYHAIRETLADFSLPAEEETFREYHRINKALWEALERGETTQRELKVERFKRLLALLGKQGVCAKDVAARYEKRLSSHAELLPGAMEFLHSICGSMKIALVSNGVSAIQRERLARCPFTPLMDAVVISEEIGVSKPDPRMVETALEMLGCTDKSQAVLMGDSLTADIAAARNAGVDSIFLNLKGRDGAAATYTVTSLAEAARLLTEG